MKIKFTLFLSIIVIFQFFTPILGQITTTSIFSANDQLNIKAYDSLENFVAYNPHQYIGQELYLKQKPEKLRKEGYEGFLKDFTKRRLNKANVYKCCSHDYSKYDSLNSKYFKVLDVINHPKREKNVVLYNHLYFLKLEEKQSKDIVYYEYDCMSIKRFPFIAVGYFEKQKNKYIGTEYLLRGRNWFEGQPEMRDIKSGKPVDYSSGTIWKCVDLTLEGKYYLLSLILENNKGERLFYSLENLLKSNFFVIEKSLADKYKQKFGVENWDLILAGKLKVGMTKEMCEISMGKPNAINYSKAEIKKPEQWVYPSKYLYFEDDILTIIQ